MKIKTILANLKAGRRFYVMNGSECQFLGDGNAFYAMYGMPTLEKETIFRLSDVPPEKENDYFYEEVGFSDEYDFSDCVIDEKTIKDFFPIVKNGNATLLPLRIGGVQICFIQEKYLKPFSDDENILLYERTSKSGITHIVVKRGITLVAVILPCVMFASFTSDIHMLGTLTYNTYKKMIDNYNDTDIR